MTHAQAISTEQPIERFRQQLRSGELVLGMAVTFNDPLVTDAIADSVDYVWIDTEHTAMDPAVLNGHLLACRGKGTPALVRVRDSKASTIKPVLDSGADGIIVPQVQSLEEVEEAVANCLYPPAGRRGMGPRVPSNYGRDGGEDYLRRANEAVFISVQIETTEALEALDEIVRVPRLDSIVIGPYDLSGALGVLGDVEHPKVVEAVQRIIAAAHSAGIWVGAGMPADAEYAEVMARRGVHWVQLGCDFEYMIKGMDQVSARVRQQLGREPVAGAGSP